MDMFGREFFKKTSIGLPDGGDTHLHPWENQRGCTVTTRLKGIPGGFEEHDDFRLDSRDRSLVPSLQFNIPKLLSLDLDPFGPKSSCDLEERVKRPWEFGPPPKPVLLPPPPIHDPFMGPLPRCHPFCPKW